MRYEVEMTDQNGKLLALMHVTGLPQGPQEVVDGGGASGRLLRFGRNRKAPCCLGINPGGRGFLVRG